MRKLARDDMEMKTDGWQLHHLRFADDIVLTTSSISQAERLLTDFDETCGCIGLQLNLQETVFLHDEIDLRCSIHARRNEHIRAH
ncbi:hypothetical protein RB195_011464 [Necator americanus]|uniref:Reverse transcriptase domain-containing protein n=1 Tax=Necator americanus TaxID=51031 RepID=A0ABR1D4A3_NECAM